MDICLRSTLSGREYPLARLEEYTPDGESLEVFIHPTPIPLPIPGISTWERYRPLLHFPALDMRDSLGEGGTPLVAAGSVLSAFTGIEGLFLKNEAQNPTWSFKDRGSLACVWLARHLGEKVLATISTGNMAQSTAAYGARAGMEVIVFVHQAVPPRKMAAALVHGASVVRIGGCDYTGLKSALLELAPKLGIRLTTGNNAWRVEGYKTVAFEILDALGRVPEWIAVPTSACGLLRGIFKGFRELEAVGLTSCLPRMIVAQPALNAPIVAAIRTGHSLPVPFPPSNSVAEALGSGNPPGGGEIISKARELGWLAEEVEEGEILAAQARLAKVGFLVEASAAITLPAVAWLRKGGQIGARDQVVLMLTGSGQKEDHWRGQEVNKPLDTELGDIAKVVESLLK